MIDQVFLIIFCILVYEIILRSGLLTITKSSLHLLQKVTKIIPSKNVSDHWKERMVPVYAWLLLKNSFLTLGILCSVILLFFVFYLLSPSFYILSLSILGIAESVAIIVIYNQLKKRL